MLSSDGSKANIFSVKTPSFQGFEAGEEDFIKKTGRTNCSPKMSRKEKKKFLSLLCQ